MAKEKRLRDGKKKRRRKSRKRWSLGDVLGVTSEQASQKISLSKSAKRRQKKARKKKELQYWESLSAEELEDAFNYWNRQQTTGLTIDELTPKISVDDDVMLLVTIDLAVDREKVALMKKGKQRDNLQKLLKKLP